MPVSYIAVCSNQATVTVPPLNFPGHGSPLRLGASIHCIFVRPLCILSTTTRRPCRVTRGLLPCAAHPSKIQGTVSSSMDADIAATLLFHARRLCQPRCSQVPHPPKTYLRFGNAIFLSVHERRDCKFICLLTVTLPEKLLLQVLHPSAQGMREGRAGNKKLTVMMCCAG